MVGPPPVVRASHVPATAAPLPQGRPTTIPTVMTSSAGPGLFVRALWFIFIGWWATGILLFVAYVFSLTVVLLPISFILINAVPVVLTLRSRRHHVSAEMRDGVLYIDHGHVPQRSFLLRAAWFVLVGWWFTGFWMAVGYFLCLTIILLPVGLMMMNRIPEVMTLRRT